MFHVKRADAGGLEGVWRGSGGGLDAAGARLVRAGGVLALVWLAACSAPEDAAGKTAAAAPETAAAASTPPSPPSPAPAKVDFTDNEAKTVKGGEAKREFAYSWPAEVSAIPALAARFTAERDKQLAEQKADWQGSLEEFADSDCFGCVNRDAQTSWDVVANLPRFLSLSQAFYAYTGGAHGNSGSAGLVWDREAGKALEPEDFFTSAKAMQDALGPRWCKALAEARRAKMGGDAPVNDDTFPCPPIKDLTVLLGSKGKTAFDRIGLIADPYVAGSYAEGQYEVTIPVTPAVLAAVKPEYKAAFALGK